MEITVICTYDVKEGSMDAFRALLTRHWSTLNQFELVGPTPSRLMAGYDKGADNRIVEIFEWKSHEASASAHQLPEVLAIWEPMGQHCESMDFKHFTALG